MGVHFPWWTISPFPLTSLQSSPPVGSPSEVWGNWLEPDGRQPRDPLWSLVQPGKGSAGCGQGVGKCWEKVGLNLPWESNAGWVRLALRTWNAISMFDDQVWLFKGLETRGHRFPASDLDHSCHSYSFRTAVEVIFSLSGEQLISARTWTSMDWFKGTF